MDDNSPTRELWNGLSLSCQHVSSPFYYIHSSNPICPDFCHLYVMLINSPPWFTLLSGTIIPESAERKAEAILWLEREHIHTHRSHTPQHITASNFKADVKGQDNKSRWKEERERRKRKRFDGHALRVALSIANAKSSTARGGFN